LRARIWAFLEGRKGLLYTEEMTLYLRLQESWILYGEERKREREEEGGERGYGDF
jgi:hypothetical protein